MSLFSKLLPMMPSVYLGAMKKFFNTYSDLMFGSLMRYATWMLSKRYLEPIGDDITEHLSASD